MSLSHLSSSSISERVITFGEMEKGTLSGISSPDSLMNRIDGNDSHIVKAMPVLTIVAELEEGGWRECFSH